LSEWVLDVRAREGGAEVVLVNRFGSVRRAFLRLSYVTYLLPKKLSPQELAEAVTQHPQVLAASIEFWRVPPWYDREVPVVKVLAESLRAVKEVTERAEELGVGERVNTYPNPLTQALWRAGLNPCSRVDPVKLKTVEDLSDPFYRPPPYKVVELHIKKRSGTFTLRCNGESVQGKLRDLVTYSDVFAEAHVLLYSGPIREVAREFPEVLKPLVKVCSDRSLVGVTGLVEWCRISWTPLRLLANATIGKVLTTVEGLEALKRRYLVPERPARAESFRPVSELVRADRGGMVLTPEPGVYFNVAQLDFNSLYPTIIAEYNISPETVGRPDCSNYFEVPEVGHRVCLDVRGVVPAVLEDLVRRRQRIKEAMRGADRCLREVLDERQAALKWVLVASFGYLGYRNARFGKIEAYESVTALARYVLKKAVAVAEREGFKVLHAIVDSIFVTKEGAEEEDYVRLAEAVAEEVGISVKVEALYDWVVFPPTTRGVGAPTKYFGRLRGGGIKVKGIRAVSEAYPPVVRKAQQEAIEILARARNREEFTEAVRQALRAVEGWIEKVLTGSVDPEDLVIKRRLRKVRYVSRQPHVIAAQAAGIKGGYVEYVMAATPYPADLGFRGYSRKYYLGALRKVLSEVRELAEYVR